jgi:hypothetical protein
MIPAVASDVELPAEALRILKLARRDRDQAKSALAALPVDQQVALVCETPVARRGELLDLLPSPELVVPALPEAELCFTVKAIGLADAGWVLAHASDEQVQACVDLDAWHEDQPETSRLGEWIGSLAEAGDEALLRAAHALDAELLMLWLHERVEVHQKPDDDTGWQPPAGARTLEGQFYVSARRSGDDLEEALRLLELLFQDDYWFYFRLLQAVNWESPADNEEHALRWRTGRLQDLGFPPREEALAIYAHPRHDELETLPEASSSRGGEWHLPVWMPELPAAADPRHALFQAAADLDAESRRAFFYAFVALANQVAVADRLPLGDVESLPRAIEKAAALASRGLEWLAVRHGVAPAEALRRAPLVRLFRIGVRLDRGDPET